MMNAGTNRFWSRVVHDLQPHVSGEQAGSAGLIKLNTNESPFGPSPRVLDAIRARNLERLIAERERITVGVAADTDRLLEAVSQGFTGSDMQP